MAGERAGEAPAAGDYLTALYLFWNIFQRFFPEGSYE